MCTIQHTILQTALEHRSPERACYCTRQPKRCIEDTSCFAKLTTCLHEMNWLVTRQGFYFKVLLMEIVTVHMHIIHHFTLVYSPWSNKTVGQAFKEVIRTVSHFFPKGSFRRDNAKRTVYCSKGDQYTPSHMAYAVLDIRSDLKFYLCLLRRRPLKV